MSKRNKICTWTEEISAWLLGGLSATRAGEVERHVAGCAACAAQRDEFSRTLFRLRALPPEPASRDLAPEILARLERCASATWWHPLWLRAAAVLLVVFGIGGALAWRAHRTSSFDLAATVPPGPSIINHQPLLPPVNPADKTQAVTQALAWLERTQDPDGHWDTARWSAQRMYTVGLTALSLLALSTDEKTVTAEQRATLGRGLDWLAAQQNERGQFGPDGSATMYNHSMATLAFLEGLALETNAAQRAVCAKAVAFIVAAQRPSGGWGYSHGASDNVNTAVTVWQLQALLRADELGFSAVRPHIDRGLAWLGGRVSAEGRMGYRRADDFPNGSETLTAAGVLCLLRTPAGAQDPRVRRMLAWVRGAAGQTAPDYYRWYFVSAALAAAGGTADPALDQLRASVLARQTHAGADAGSWLPGDRWSRAGGRIYATAMAVLALQSG